MTGHAYLPSSLNSLDLEAYDWACILTKLVELIGLGGL
jgi:hypothetical protein